MAVSCIIGNFLPYDTRTLRKDGVPSGYAHSREDAVCSHVIVDCETGIVLFRKTTIR